jgi:hypothetical protein
MASRPVIWLLVAGAIALACGPHARRNDAKASTTDGRADTTPKKTAKSIPEAQALAASAKVAVHDGVSFTLHVTNLADHALELNFPSGKTHDFVVVDSAGRVVWRWSDGQMFTQALQNKLLDPNETLTYEEKWNASGLRGRFTARALLESSNHPVEERIDFTLP